jgi:hypothetical protein
MPSIRPARQLAIVETLIISNIGARVYGFLKIKIIDADELETKPRIKPVVAPIETQAIYFNALTLVDVVVIASFCKALTFDEARQEKTTKHNAFLILKLIKNIIKTTSLLIS